MIFFTMRMVIRINKGKANQTCDRHSTWTQHSLSGYMMDIIGMGLKARIARPFAAFYQWNVRNIDGHVGVGDVGDVGD